MGNVTTLMEDEPVAPPVVDTKDEDSDTMDYFQKLAKED